MSGLFPGRPLPDNLEFTVEVAAVSGGTARLGIRRARAGDLADAYPAGAHDRELFVEGHPSPESAAELGERTLAADPRCRRIVLPVPEQDLDAISWAEAAGYRYVVDVQTYSGSFSLLVLEPEWVLAQPHILEDIPLKE